MTAGKRKPRRRRNNESNRREALLRVSARLFRQKGFDGTTIRDIAKAAGMHSGSPFYHFRSKQEILLAVMEQGLAEGLRRSEAVMALDLPPDERLERLIRTHLGTILEDGNDFIPVLLYDWRSLSRENRRRIIAVKDRYDALWQRLLDELAAAGRLTGDTRLTRLLIFGAINWSGQWYRAGARLSLDEVAAGAARLFLHRR
jgi:TetR/AcrR family transcriptional regulator, cholesterol catabolism regulator